MAAAHVRLLSFRFYITVYGGSGRGILSKGLDGHKTQYSIAIFISLLYLHNRHKRQYPSAFQDCYINTHRIATSQNATRQLGGQTALNRSRSNKSQKTHSIQTHS